MAIPLARSALMAALLALILVASSPAAAQDVPSCVSKLTSCAQYINSTATPPASCCGPLNEAATNETACLCALLNDKAVLKAFNVDPEKGFQLAKRCGVSADQSTCAKTTSAGSGSGTSASNSTATPTGQTNSVAQKMSWIGVSGLASLLFFCWSIIA
ncbi:non-specific lipid transfer protein GPI-anchored 3-like [Typha latifolia]|uniref:non-specific lipid transfer protein GPI-anchored 3-like n=1 Tax=Typha latifolia TaxID=4733 RepID=UPI003C2AE1B2